MRLSISHFTLVAALAVSACGAPASGGGPQPLTPLSRWSLTAEPQYDRIALAVHETGPSANQRSALAEMAARARAEQSHEILVSTPSGDDPASLQMGWAVAEALRSSGIPVRMESYDAADPRAPVMVAFARLQAVTYECSREWGSLTRHADNGSPQGMGCSTISNMAAQIAEPRDILGQRPMDPADAGRRSVVLDHYRRGEPTATQGVDGGSSLSDAVE